jgi:S1-C subfamily serine protease
MNRSWMVAIAALVAVGPIRAQDAPQSKEQAPLVVDGQVKGVYRDAKPDRVDVVVEIKASVTGAPGAPIDAQAQRSNSPRPPIDGGETVYVHVYQAVGREGGYKAVPAEGAWVRAYLYPRGDGWQGAFPDWLEPRTAPDGPQSVPGDPAAPRELLRRFGVKAEPVETSGRLILKITEVLPGTPAQKAGFEKGDVVIGVNDSGFASLQKFADLLTQGPATAEFVVLNVRNNEQATVQVDVADVIKIKDGPPRRPAPAPTAPKRSLGVELEPVRLGVRPALKVTKVRPGGPAQEAGFEVGDVLVEAGGIALADEAKLQEAVDKAGATLTVTVRNVRTGKDVPVEVALGGPPAPTPSPSPTPRPTPEPSPTPAGGVNSQRIGLTVKPGTADLLPVVKVTAVVPGGPAARAGVEVGDAIVGVNDRVVFAPDLFEEALKDVGPSFTLTVLDVKTGKKTPMKVDLGR